MIHRSLLDLRLGYSEWIQLVFSSTENYSAVLHSSLPHKATATAIPFKDLATEDSVGMAHGRLLLTDTSRTTNIYFLHTSLLCVVLALFTRRGAEHHLFLQSFHIVTTHKTLCKKTLEAHSVKTNLNNHQIVLFYMFC